MAAGQSGDIDTVRALLEHHPGHLHAISSVNGHTVLLQAVFYGTTRHRELVAWLLDRATPDERRRMLTAYNVRGYTATTMARLWHIEPLMSLLSTVDETTAAERDAYRERLLASIAPHPSAATDELIAAVATPLDEARIAAAIAAPGLDLDRRGGPLSQTPVIAALTGTDTEAENATENAAETVADHLEQIRWSIAHGARTDIADHTGLTAAGRARAALGNPVVRDRARAVLAALGEPLPEVSRG